MKKVFKNEKETLDFARDFGKKLKGGEVLKLIGELGAGKTVFTKGLAEGLGVKDIVSSPTFLLMKCYKGKKKLCHIDAYRLSFADELLDIGVSEHLQKKNTVVVVEWADRVSELFKDLKTIEIKFEYGKKEGERVIKISNN
ncbi:MAG: tRNA (adenosine(37)-N6)-threonylcarbamoyltransferase complex ATPase subunit type 1 TsaE [Parcubacteria group bacterium]|nr:tRNA (adenosine(37)-N6)-threonylcarbamoyltransferase complex ATPase subunit type 1 TsaE [Parcubacteria group bacterium]